LVVGYASAFEWPRGYLTIPFDQHLLISIAFATFLTAFLIWRRLPQDESDAKRGAMAGFFAGIVSHPLTWLVYFLAAAYLIPPQGTETVQLHQVLGGTLFYSFFSLLIYGLFTVLTTTFAGACVGYVCSTNREPNDDADDSNAHLTSPKKDSARHDSTDWHVT